MGLLPKIPLKTFYLFGRKIDLTWNDLIESGINILFFYLIYIAAISDLMACKAQNIELLQKYNDLFYRSPKTNSTIKLPSNVSDTLSEDFFAQPSLTNSLTTI